jgi:hypothetical protein
LRALSAVDRDSRGRNPWELTVTQAPTKGQDMRRHPNGCIDVDFYRTRATALRGQAKRDAAALRAAGAVVLAMAGVLAITVMVAAIPAPAPTSHSTAAQSRAYQFGGLRALENEWRFAARAHATWEARP